MLPCSKTHENSDKFCTNLFVVFDLIIEDNAIGSFRLLPGQGDAVSRRLLLFDHRYRGGSWVGDTDRHRVKDREWVPSLQGSVEVQSPGVASWQLSMVPVSVIQFAAQWGHIKGCGPGLVGGTRGCSLMQRLDCVYTDLNTSVTKCISLLREMQP